MQSILMARFIRVCTWQNLIIACSTIVLAACVAKRSKYDVPVIPLPNKFSKPPIATIPAESLHKSTPAYAQDPTDPGIGINVPPVTPLGDVLANWWRLLGSDELNGLMDRALSNNQDLHIAALRIAEAKARAEQASAGRFPSISVPLAVSNVAPYYGVGTVQPGQPVTHKITYEASIRGDMRADIWGERQSLYESSDLQLWSTTFQRDDVQRTLVANVVSNYVNYLSLNDRIRVAHETENVLSGMENSALERMKGGDATIIDVEQMRAEVNSVRATIPVLELQREQMIDSIALLVGSVPAMLTLSDKGLDSLSYPALLPGVPSELLLRRPDVRSVEAQLIAADANIDVARTEVLPPLDLTLEVGTGASTLSQLFKSNTIFWNAIANLSANIFDDGKRSNEVVYARAVHEEMVESYVRVIYRAVRDVEDSLAFVRKMGDRVKAQGASVDAAHKAWDYSAESYSAGAVDYLVLLDTERTYHAKLDDLHSDKRDQYLALVNLFLSLGGGVQQGEAIPGKGKRPVLPAEAGSGVVLAAAPESPSIEGIDFEDKDQKRDNKEVWLVELPAMYDSGLIGAAWRDLQGRFPQLMANHRLWPRMRGRVVNSDKNEERAAWYRLFIADFPTSKEAEDFCNSLSQMRCRAVSSRSSEFLDGVAVAPKGMQVEAAKKSDAKSIKHETIGSPKVYTANKATAGRIYPEHAAAVHPTPATAPESAPAPVPGPQASEEADSGNAAIQSVAPEPIASAAVRDGDDKNMPEPSPGKAVKPGYAVQVGTFNTLSKANKSVSAWKAKGYEPYVYKTEKMHGHSWFTVRIGNFHSRSEASASAKSIKEKTRVRAIPVPILSDAVTSESGDSVIEDSSKGGN